MNRLIKQQVLKHLAEYKRHKLGIDASGVWWGNGLPYDHILPLHEANKNLISEFYGQPLVDLVFSQRVKPHPGFHHLNSSQALTVNLFGPLELEKNYEACGRLIGTTLPEPHGLFEHVENYDEGTNFDFFIQSQQAKYFFEVKYTEDRFGAAKDDARHREKFERIYKDMLRPIVAIDRKEFFRKYQLWRNIAYSSMGTVVFVLPRFRRDLIDEVRLASERIAEPDSVKILLIDELSEELERSCWPALSGHNTEFFRKYLNIEGI